MWWLMLMSMMRKPNSTVSIYRMSQVCLDTVNANMLSWFRDLAANMMQVVGGWRSFWVRHLLDTATVGGPWPMCWVQDLEMFRSRFRTFRLSWNLATLASLSWTLRSGNRTEEQVFGEIWLCRQGFSTAILFVFYSQRDRWFGCQINVIMTAGVPWHQ